MEYTEVYKGPFVTDLDGLYIKCSDGTEAFSCFSKGAKETSENIVSLLNGNHGKKYRKWQVSIKDDRMFVDGLIFVVRGWGHLIGTKDGGLGLSDKEAVKIQFDFMTYVAKAITSD